MDHAILCARTRYVAASSCVSTRDMRALGAPGMVGVRRGQYSVCSTIFDWVDDRKAIY